MTEAVKRQSSQSPKRVQHLLCPNLHHLRRTALSTVTLNIIALRSVERSTVTVPNSGHFRANLGSQESLSGLLDRALGLGLIVALETVGKKLKLFSNV
jgi:hypothetical protein